jgi:hypothetical protein
VTGILQQGVVAAFGVFRCCLPVGLAGIEVVTFTASA